MRLLVISSWMPYPPDNGSRLRAYHLLNHLARAHSLTLLTFGEPGASEDLGPLREFCARVEVVPPPKVDRRRLGMAGLFSPIPRYYAQAWSPHMAGLVDGAVGAHDALLALAIDAALYALEATAAIPSVLDELEVAVFRERAGFERNPWGRFRHRLTWWKFRRFVRLLVERLDRTTVVSVRERDHLRSIGCDIDRVAVVPNGMDVPDGPPVTVRAPRLIYPGSVTYSANLDAVRFFVMEVFPLIRRSRPDVEFVVTGATDGVDITGLTGRDGVRFTGRLPDVGPSIAESAACVVPLRVGGGTRLKVLHAMAVGTPVVSTSKGIEGLEVDPDRHVLVADSPESFAGQVLRVLNDSQLGTRLASASVELVRARYAWKPIARTLEEVIEAAVAERRAGRLGRGAWPGIHASQSGGRSQR